MYETAKIKDVIKDIDFDEDLTEVDMEETLIEQKAAIIMEVPKSFEGFKTASNKNINISKEALAKTKNIFQDLGSTEFPNKSSNSIDKEYPNIIDIEQPSTSKAEFVGFKTANNKNIKISKQALAKVHNIFKDIDKTDFPKKNKDLKENTNEENISDHPSTSKISFVGFKTANKKDINISKDALAKTKNIFQDIDSTNFKLPSKKNTDSTKIYPENSKTVKDFDQPTTSKSSFVGFKTASNKNIKISEAALAKIKNIFKDIDSTDFKFPENGKKIDEGKMVDKVGTTDATLVKPSYTGFKTANNKDIEISDKALAKTKYVFKDLDSDDFKYPETLKKNGDKRITDDDLSTHEVRMINSEMPSTSTVSFAGFKTANNKKIDISKEALAKTKNIFKDIDATDFKLPEKVHKCLKTSKQEKETTKRDDQKKKIETEDFNQIGFKTASNRNITISKESLARTKNIFKDIDETDFMFPEKVNKDKIPIKRDDNNILESEMIDLNQPSTSKSGFIGFKTANNKNITISKESLAKTKNIFKDIDEADLKFPEKSSKNKDKADFISKGSFVSKIIELNQPSTSKARYGGFKTVNNNTLAISEDSLASNEFEYPKKGTLEKAKRVKTPFPSLKQSGSKIGKTETGFKTANNKVINVSETALAKSKNLFEDLGSVEFRVTTKVKDDYPNIEIDDMGTNINSDTGIRNNDFKLPKTTVPKFQGFQTASNKTVKVSAEALFKSRKIFQDIGVSQDLKEAGEKDVLDADNEPLHIKKGIHNDSVDQNKNGGSSPIFKGFQTANKKPVAICEEALAKSRKLFEDIETIQDEPEPAFHGFKTGNNEEVEVSQKTLAETKKLFEDVIKKSRFQGFQTASDKKVVISDEALAKSRKVFQNLDKDEHLLLNNETKSSNIKFGFKTGSNRDVLVSDEAIARSKRRFSEIDDSFFNVTSKKKDIVIEDNIANMIDTQLLNNFDESLHTEDFHDTPVKSKRSGSPILSCPRAKRRKKFETPYSQKLPTPVKKQEIFKTMKDTSKISFTENYKKNKKYNLKDLAEITKNNTSKIDPYILKFTFDDLLKFEFHENRNEISNGNLTTQSLKDLFLNSVNSKLVPNGWLDNHLKLILWKLISYEVKFKSLTVTARNVIDQLKYRYDKELYYAQRPALRKILEKDDAASKTLVLCVAGILLDGVNVVRYV